MEKVYLVERMHYLGKGQFDNDVRFIGTTEKKARQYCEKYPTIPGCKQGYLKISHVTVDSDDFYACVGDHIANYNMKGEQFFGRDPEMTISLLTNGKYTRTPFAED